MLKDSILVVSIGRHTRLGDVLETALDGLRFQTIEAEELETADCTDARVLFAASADPVGENEPMRRLTARLLRDELRLCGAVCAMIADGEQGGAMRTDALRLLLAANAAGAEVLPQALLESGRDLRALDDISCGQTPFERYRVLARTVTRRLAAYERVEKEQQVRLVTTLESGVAQDWRAALKRLVPVAGLETAEPDGAERTMLLAENAHGLPEERVLALLRGNGRLACLIASPALGGELYALALLDQVCIRGSYALAPEGMLLFEGMSAVEVLAGRGKMGRAEALLTNLRAGTK